MLFSSCEKDEEERKQNSSPSHSCRLFFPPIKIMVEKEIKIHAFKYACIKNKKHFVDAVYGKKKGFSINTPLTAQRLCKLLVNYSKKVQSSRKLRWPIKDMLQMKKLLQI